VVETDITTSRRDRSAFRLCDQSDRQISFPAMIWLMLRGELPSKAQAELLGAVLVSRSITARSAGGFDCAHGGDLRRRLERRDRQRRKRARRRAWRRRAAMHGAAPRRRARHVAARVKTRGGRAIAAYRERCGEFIPDTDIAFTPSIRARCAG